MKTTETALTREKMAGGRNGDLNMTDDGKDEKTRFGSMFLNRSRRKSCGTT